MMVSGLVSYPLGLMLESVFPFRVPVDRNPPASHAQGAIQRAGLPSRGLASKHRENGLFKRPDLPAYGHKRPNDVPSSWCFV
jgi:hypothetical protein